MRRIARFQCKGRRKMSGSTCIVTSKLRLAVFLATAVVVLLSVDARADFGFPGLTITGDVDFAEGSFYVEGPPTMSGSFSKTVGGSTTSSTFDDTGVTGGDPDPQSGTLTDIGDGFGILVTDALGSDPSLIDALGLDLTMNLENLSGSELSITIGWDFSHSVDAGGDEAYMKSEFFLVELDNAIDRHPIGAEILLRDVSSDTFYEDELNGTGLGTYGALVSDSDIDSFGILLGPGETFVLGGAFSMWAETFASDSDYTGDFNVALTVTNVVPEPSTVLLLSIGCLSILRRKGKIK